MRPRKTRNSAAQRRATRDAIDALVRSPQFPTRASWDAYLDQRAQEREELERLQVPEESVDAVLGELDPGHDAR